jgi:UDPglucose--hexose-1-phosphate uridylyltransferase
MELRKDPITKSWVIVGHPDHAGLPEEPCPLCPGSEAQSETLLYYPNKENWKLRVVPHMRPLYRADGEFARTAEGIYDRMGMLGAHEVVIETRDHLRSLQQMSDDEIKLVLDAWAARLVELKRDKRFKYVTVFKNHGPMAGEEWSHSNSQVSASTFVPRRILYELRAAREWYAEKERCVFCDILRQDVKHKKRIVETIGDYVALCPFASRVPYETWIMPQTHHYLFESATTPENRRDLARLLGRTIRRLSHISDNYHLVLHTAPNTQLTKGELSQYWKTIAGDYHWHIEILPIVEKRSKSYSIKEIYFNAQKPEQAAERLREFNPEL